MDPESIEIVKSVQGYTMTSPERLFGLCEAVRSISRCDIPGAIVECGVWRGGSMMAAAKALLVAGQERERFLFDTFEGMTEPPELDVDAGGGEKCLGRMGI
jgi:hypothetical protein